MTEKAPAMNTDYPLPPDWRGEVMAKIRTLIKEADPQIVEEVKYKTRSNPDGVLVWYCDGMISTGEIYKQHLRLGFAKGNLLKDQDPQVLINSYRAVILHEEDKLDQIAFINLVRAAVKLNRESKNKSKSK